MYAVRRWIMNTNQSYKLFNKKILSETVNGETLIVNLEVGHYFTLQGIGSFIWQLLLHGLSVEKISALIVNQGNCDTRRVASDIDAFIAELVQEKLIRPCAQPANAFIEQIDESVLGGFSPDGSYMKTAFQKFTDMEALLLADPIHEFTDQTIEPVQ